MAKIHKMTRKEYEELTKKLIQMWTEYQALRQKWKFAEIVDEENK